MSPVDRTISFLKVIATTGFLLLYPGFFLYHYALGQGWISRVVMGLYGPVTLAIAIVSIIPFLLILSTFVKFSAKFGILLLFISFISYALSWVWIFGFADSSVNPAINNQHLTIILSWSAVFIVGFFMSFNSKNFGMLCWWLWSVVSLIVFFSLDAQTLMFKSMHGSSDDISTYQGFARSYFYLSLLLISLARKPAERMLLLPVSFAALFLIGARSEMAAFVVIMVALLLISQRTRPIRLISMFILVGLLMLVVLNAGDYLLGSRQLNLLNLGADASWSERGELSELAGRQIAASPILGQYGGHVQTRGFGLEAHNALSIWVSFGFFGFVMYMGLVAISLYVSLLRYLRFPHQPEALFAFLICAAGAILVLFAKSVFWAESALGWGLAASLLLKQPFGRMPRWLANTAAASRPVLQQQST
jgi:hypothetical protein